VNQEGNIARVVSGVIIGIGGGVLVGSLLAYFTDYPAIGVGAGAVLGLGLGVSLALRNGGGEP
jgi:hypothetical protein